MYSPLDAIVSGSKHQRMDELNRGDLGSRRISGTPTARWLRRLFALVALLLTLVGCCLVGAGIFITLSTGFERPLLTNLGIAAIALGTGSIVTGILGCCTVFTKRNAIHVTFVVLATFELLSALVVGCWLLLQRNTLHDDSRNSLRIAIDQYFEDETSRLFMNDLQLMLSCCGADRGFADYGHHSELDPSTVCEMEFYGTPCHEPLIEYLSQKLLLVLGLTAGSAFLLVLALVQFLVMFCTGSRTNVDETI